MAEQSLVAFQVDSRERAHELFHVLLRQDEADDAVKITDAVCVYLDGDKIKIEQTTDASAGEGAFGGGVVGVVVGLIAGGPLGAVIGGVAGGAIGSVYSAIRDTGINNRKIKEIARSIAPGQAALVLLYSGTLSEEMLGTLREFDSGLIYDTLPDGAEAAVRAALSGAGVTADAPATAPIVVTLADEPQHGEVL